MRRKFIGFTKRVIAQLGIKRVVGGLVLIYLISILASAVAVAQKNYSISLIFLLLAAAPSLALTAASLALVGNERRIRRSRRPVSRNSAGSRKSLQSKARELSGTLSLYAPNAVTSIPQAKKAENQQAGRLAAAQVADPESALKMSFLLDRQDPEHFKRAGAFVGSLRRSQQIGPSMDVTLVYPSADPITLNPEISVLVIDETSLADNGWYGVLDSSGASKFMELQKHVIEIKERRGLVIGVVGKEISHLTHRLREQFDVAIDAVTSDISPIEASDVSLVSELASALTGGCDE